MRTYSKARISGLTSTEHDQNRTLPDLPSPGKNVWLVDARPRDIAKFKMAAIPPSFVYSSGKKISCRLIWVANAYTDFLRIAQTFYYPFSPIPMGFVPFDARVLAGLPDSALDLFKRSLALKLLRLLEVFYLFFFTEKIEQNFFFSSKTL